MQGGKAATKAEKHRMKQVVELGCIACRIRGVTIPCGVDELHHLLHSFSQRRGHEDSVCLGSWHHRGVAPFGYTRKEATEYFGPAYSDGTKLFKEAFGKDDFLLAKTNELLEKNQPLEKT